jgi:hypothetical protein
MSAGDDEKKSSSPSHASSRVESFAKASTSDKVEKIFFKFLLPLYDQERRRLPIFTLIIWAIKLIEMVSLALFTID